MAKERSIKKALAAASDYLVAYVGEKAFPGKPQFDEKRSVWSIPLLCQTSRGIFLGGKIELSEAFDLIYAPSKSEFTRVVEAQLKRLPVFVYADEAELAAKGFEVAKLA